MFGIAVGGLLGAVSRRALTGMFLGLLVFMAVRAFVSVELRPNYEVPLVAYGNTMSSAVTAPPRKTAKKSSEMDPSRTLARHT